MTSLEFIEKLIENEQSMIKTYEEFFKTDKTEFDKQITNGYIQKHQKNIHHLQQIKTILEAWEVVKWSISKEHLEDSQIRTMFGENPFMNITEEEKLIVKKALEVENE